MRMMGLIFVAISFAGLAHAGNDCASIAYQNHNMVDYGPFKVRAIAGVVEDPQRSPIAGACVTVFTDDGDHRMLASTKSDNSGQYLLPQLPDGKYRVVASCDSLCAANVPVVLSGKVKAQALHIVMKPGGIDTCSYGELK